MLNYRLRFLEANATQYPVDKWHLKLPDPTIADAICDRLTHGAIKLNLEGDSMRKNKEKSAAK